MEVEGGLVCGLMFQSTAMVMPRLSFNLFTLSLGKLRLRVNQFSMHIIPLFTDNSPT